MPVPPPVVPSFVRGLPLTREALAVAERLHGGQRREVDGAPFVIHPLEVASLLYNMGHSDVVIAAGVLHDTVEDTAAEVDDLELRFGEGVASLVAAMTEDSDIEDYEERKAKLRRQIADSAPAAAAIYAADKVTKVRELRAQATRDAGALKAGAEKLQHYVASLEMLEEVAPAYPLVRQLRFEIEMLHTLPPSATDAPDAGG